MRDGHVNKCKDCNKKDVTENRDKNIERIREYDRKRATLPHRAEMTARYTKQYRAKNPDKYRAHGALGGRITSGDIKKEPCAICGNNNVHAHHVDYDDPYDVIWVCAEHHKWFHRN